MTGSETAEDRSTRRRERRERCRAPGLLRVIVPWLARIARLRARSDARLLLVVLAVAVVSATMVTSLALLVTVTEQGGLRSALGERPGAEAAIDVGVIAPSVPIIEVESALADAVDFALADAVPATGTTIALTDFASVGGIPPASGAAEAGPAEQKPVLGYFGELDRIEQVATLVDGEWPGRAAESDSPAPQPGDRIAVAIPESAAQALGLTLGDSLTVGGTAAQVTGVYRMDDRADPYWRPDLLDAAGIERDFPLPGTRVFVATDAIGPLVTARGALDGAAIAVRTVDIRFRPDFRTLALDDLGAMADRLADARSRVPAQAGDVGEQVIYSSDLSEVVDDASSGLVVTRSTVITVGLLLLLVALVALAQCARLLTDSRIDERRLLRARGASLAGIRGITAIEAVGIGVAAAVASPLLASLVYRAIAAHPAMRAAGMPADAGLPPLVWAVALVIAVVFVGVLMAPLARPVELFDDERGEQRAARRIRPLGLVRLGIDIGIAAIAVLLYQQLVSYRAPVGVPSVRIDPLLVVAPALLLGATSYLAVRLVPAIAALLDRVGSWSRGAVLSLASWEVGRRTRQATAVVLLLTLALAVGSFGSTFFSTWRQSQTDQAAFALGAPVRVPVVPDEAAAQGEALADGARGQPQPVLRRPGRLAAPSAIGSDALGPSGPPARILGLGADARSMLDRGRIAQEGGSVIEQMLRSEIPPTTTIALPADARGLAMTVRIGAPGEAFPGVVGSVSAVIEDANGLIGTVAIGTVPVDGTDYAIQGVLPLAAAPDSAASGDAASGDAASGDAASGSESSGPGLVGLVVDFGLDESGSFQLRTIDTRADVLVGSIAALVPDPASPGAGDDTAGDGTGADGTGGDTAADGTGGDDTAADDTAASALIAQPLPVDALASWIPHAPGPNARPATLTDAPEGWQLALRLTIPRDVDGRPAIFSVTGWEDPARVPVVASARLAQLMSIEPGANVTLVLDGALIPVELVDVVELVPGSIRGPGAAVGADTTTNSRVVDAIVVDQVLLSRYLAVAGTPALDGSAVDEWWVDVAPGRGQAYLDLHTDDGAGEGAESSEAIATQQSEGPLRIATPAALFLVIAAAVVLTVVGFAVHTAASMRARRTEFAQLRAIGLARRSLVSVIGAESVLLSVLGTVFGIAIGVLLGAAIAPLVGLSTDGSAPRPSVDVVVPVVVIAGLAVVVAIVVLSVVLAVAGRQRSADPASILRGSGE